MKFDGWQIPLATIAGVVTVSACLSPTTKSETVAAWVQAVGSVAAILVAVWVAHRQYEQTRQLELERATADAAKEQAETRAFVQAVLHELAAIWGGYEANIRPLIHPLAENEFLNGIVPVAADIFTVYSNASASVGKVDDDELRRLIVHTYARAKGFVYSLQLNNHLVTDLSNFSIMHRGEDHDEVMAHKQANLVDYAVKLKASDMELEGLIRDLTARANHWLSA